MKILLLGEYSGVHQHLKLGLQALGHEVTTASHGDTWKNVRSDLGLGGKATTRRGTLSRLMFPLRNIRGLSGHDVVQFGSVAVFSNDPAVNYAMSRLIAGVNATRFLLAAGTDCFSVRAFLGLRYSPVHAQLASGEFGPLKHLSDRTVRYTSRLAESMDGIIPTGYAYSLGYRHFEWVRNPVPLPIHVEAIECKANTVGRRVRILHGVSRSTFKGSPLVRQALDIVQERFGDKVEIVWVERLPLDEYLSVMESSHIVIDQVYSYSHGMNALLAMAMGKVVLGGNEVEAGRALGLTESPVVNLRPSVSDIVERLSALIENEREIEDRGWRSRQFVKSHHDAPMVAERFVREWMAGD